MITSTPLLVLVIFAALAAAWDSEDEAAHQVRHLLSTPSQHFSSGILSTIFPPSHPDTSLHNSPLSGPEYFAPCHLNGDLTFLALPVSQNWRNALSPGANVTFVVASNPDPDVVDWRHASKEDAKKWDPHRQEWRKGMPSKLRVTLFGHVLDIGSISTTTTTSSSSSSPSSSSSTQAKSLSQAKCFMEIHKDSIKWAPGSNDSPHEAKWVQLVVDRIYAVGGFGDEHRIGWITKEAYSRAGAKVQQQLPVGSAMPASDDSSEQLHLDPEVLFGTNQGSQHSTAQAAQPDIILTQRLEKAHIQLKKGDTQHVFP